MRFAFIQSMAVYGMCDLSWRLLRAIGLPESWLVFVGMGMLLSVPVTFFVSLIVEWNADLCENR